MNVIDVMNFIGVMYVVGVMDVIGVMVVICILNVLGVIIVIWTLKSHCFQTTRLKTGGQFSKALRVPLNGPDFDGDPGQVPSPRRSWLLV